MMHAAAGISRPPFEKNGVVDFNQIFKPTPNLPFLAKTGRFIIIWFYSSKFAFHSTNLSEVGQPVSTHAQMERSILCQNFSNSISKTTDLKLLIGKCLHESFKLSNLGFHFLMQGLDFWISDVLVVPKWSKQQQFFFDAGNLFFEITFFHPSAGQTKNPAIVCHGFDEEYRLVILNLQAVQVCEYNTVKGSVE